MTSQVMTKKILEAAAAIEELGEFVKAVKAADLEPTLDHVGPFTVLAPNNEAFDRLPETLRESLFKKANRQQLMHLMACHIFPIKMSAQEVGYLSEAQSVNGNAIPISEDTAGAMLVGDAHVIAEDIECANGFLHIIDRVLVP